ncbi:MAG: hypothetical protein LBC61_02920 [Candidatus Peribacteria bacterium]|jgi:hypothetical protein|nr:hypothetical protein [Candidatus Peribacteria bacterium]
MEPSDIQEVQNFSVMDMVFSIFFNFIILSGTKKSSSSISVKVKFFDLYFTSIFGVMYM